MYLGLAASTVVTLGVVPRRFATQAGGFVGTGLADGAGALPAVPGGQKPS